MTAPVTAPAPVERNARRGDLWWWVLGAVIVLALSGVGAVLGLSLGRQAEIAGTSGAPIDVPPLPQLSAEATEPEPGTVAALAAQVLPGVVTLSIDAVGAAGSGSGFIVSDEGYLVTNNHVIEGAVASPETSRIEVIFFDGTRSEAEIVGRNVSYDLAVLSVELPPGLPVLAWGDDDRVRVGDSVIAIGAPLGLRGTVTQGIVSAVNRPVTTGTNTAQGPSYIDAIQTDASINPGNSGGPLLDGDGLVIGVNTAQATQAPGAISGNIGLGFAIPASDAQRIATEIIDTGSATTPVIGVTLDSTYPGPGALIDAVTPGSPASGAGLQPGDLITAVDGRPVADARTLIIAIRANAPGDVIELTVRRGFEEFTAEVTLEARSDVP